MAETLRESLAQGVVRIKFTKADGTERVMLATTNQDLVTYEFMQKTETAEPKSSQELLIKAWDTEKGAWRSIRKDRIIEWAIA